MANIYESDEYQITLVRRYDDLDGYNDWWSSNSTATFQQWVITVQRLPLDSYPQTSELFLGFNVIDPTVNVTTFIDQVLPEINTWIQAMDATSTTDLENNFVQAADANLTVMFSN